LGFLLFTPSPQRPPFYMGTAPPNTIFGPPLSFQKKAPEDQSKLSVVTTLLDKYLQPFSVHSLGTIDTSAPPLLFESWFSPSSLFRLAQNPTCLEFFLGSLSLFSTSVFFQFGGLVCKILQVSFDGAALYFEYFSLLGFFFWAPPDPRTRNKSSHTSQGPSPFMQIFAPPRKRPVGLCSVPLDDCHPYTPPPPPVPSM